MREDRGADRAHVVLPAPVTASKQPKHSLQIRDGAFNARSESLGKTELGIGFTLLLLVGSISFLGNRYHVNLLIQSLNDLHAFVVSLVGSNDLWIITKQFLVAL